MERVKVWDVFVRLSHWGLGLLVLGAFLTSEEDRLVPLHVRLGLVVLALVLARVAWGFAGPAPARFRAFVRRPREIVAYARALARGRPPAHLSHNPLGGAMVLALLGVLLGIVATGVIVRAGPEFEGPLTGIAGKRTIHAVKEVHEALAVLLVALVAAHVVGVVVSSMVERQNLVAGMITGRKRAPGPAARAPDAEPSWVWTGLRLGGALAVGALAAVSVALLLGVPLTARAASPVAPDLLKEYEAAARRERPGFQGFSVEAGRRLHLAEQVRDGERISCASCHTADPRQRGRTPAGKVVEPLAPSANPERFTDRREAEKWFKRNCKQVLGRECTAEEKGNYLTWLLTP